MTSTMGKFCIVEICKILFRKTCEILRNVKSKPLKLKLCGKIQKKIVESLLYVDFLRLRVQTLFNNVNQAETT